MDHDLRTLLQYPAPQNALAPIGLKPSTVFGAAVLVVRTVLVVVTDPAFLWADAAATEIKISIHLMLIPN
jgi:hypothetical protein